MRKDISPRNPKLPSQFPDGHGGGGKKYPPRDRVQRENQAMVFTKRTRYHPGKKMTKMKTMDFSMNATYFTDFLFLHPVEDTKMKPIPIYHQYLERVAALLTTDLDTQQYCWNTITIACKKILQN
ncbi:hypothetical protein CDAR_470961 [Caerostris darwini]|uniref:Uncharacterized protein n=1 Tax=Caerostris darwini TaxID=1538125 RepID=A0AAV4WBL2_9ARAC|nr:hypothetical protein CDAR_470961 [Caerostris darwini]